MDVTSWIVWKGILLGLGAAAPIGPVNVEIARRAVRNGMRAGFFDARGVMLLTFAGVAVWRVVARSL